MKRGLSSRHISMIAIGGAIELVSVATGSVVAQAGPGGNFSLLINWSYALFSNGFNWRTRNFYPVSGSFSSICYEIY